jgi:hypothetical protein
MRPLVASLLGLFLLTACGPYRADDQVAKEPEQIAPAKRRALEAAEAARRGGGDVWCAHCNMYILANHDCGVSTPCPVCKVEVASPHVHALTRYCPACRFDAGEGHACGKTHFCFSSTCLREAGANHVCDLTRYCRGCQKEVGPDHVCGRTAWCTTCRFEVTVPESSRHICGKTHWCPVCRMEVYNEHTCIEE